MSDLFKPRRVAVPLHYSMINQFMLLWVKWNRPCDLRVQRSERDRETVGICFNVLADIGKDEYIADYLRSKGYDVRKKPENVE